jgi:hypothetical protein
VFDREKGCRAAQAASRWTLFDLNYPKRVRNLAATLTAVA